MKGFLGLVSLAVVVQGVLAHTIFQELYVNGISAGHTQGIRVPTYDGPITDVNSNDIICNGGINPYRQPVSTKIIDVPAGAEVTAEWHHTLGSSEVIDASHKGPVLAYLAKVNNALTPTVTGLRWFKIYHDGLSNGVWGVDKLISNRGKVNFKIPQCIAPGNYLLRVELIALHGAGSYPGAQFYMECAQINVTGGGSANPTTVSFPGAYSGSDPGVRVNIYTGLTSYVIPGPQVFTCDASQNPGNPLPTTVIPSPDPTTTVAPAPTTAPVGTVPQWGQCGGTGYTGPTACIAPYRCVKTNDWYSQCVA